MKEPPRLREKLAVLSRETATLGARNGSIPFQTGPNDCFSPGRPGIGCGRRRYHFPSGLPPSTCSDGSRQWSGKMEQIEYWEFFLENWTRAAPPFSCSCGLAAVYDANLGDLQKVDKRVRFLAEKKKQRKETNTQHLHNYFPPFLVWYVYYYSVQRSIGRCLTLVSHNLSNSSATWLYVHYTIIYPPTAPEEKAGRCSGIVFARQQT